MRVYSNAYNAQLQSNNVNWAWCLEFFTSTKAFLTTAGHRLTYEGNNYLSNNSIASVDNVSITSELSQTPFTILLNNADSAWDNLLTHGIELRVHHVFLQTSAITGVEEIIAGAVWDRGYFKEMSDDLRNDKVAKAVFVNRLAKFDIVNNLKTTKNSIQQLNINDTTFNRSSYDEVEIQIGPKP